MKSETQKFFIFVSHVLILNRNILFHHDQYFNLCRCVIVGVIVIINCKYGFYENINRML